MRLLAAVPHFYTSRKADSPDAKAHGSVGVAADLRASAVSGCIAALHRTFGASRCVFDHASRSAIPANRRTAGRVDVVVCTTGDAHLLDRLWIPRDCYEHRRTAAAPQLLGFECHAVLRDRLGDYDYYAYLEDDLIVRDPWMLIKLGWFTGQLGDVALLQPNRYEVGPMGVAHKAYIDGDLVPEATSPYQDIREAPAVAAELFGERLSFRRTTNPHAGCFFLKCETDGDLGGANGFPGPGYRVRRAAGERGDARNHAGVPRLQDRPRRRRVPGDRAPRHGLHRPAPPSGGMRGLAESAADFTIVDWRTLATNGES